jgi:selenocysteine lyase/cysteine desulfurase
MTSNPEGHLKLTADKEPNLFEIPEGVTYLNCANMSPQLRSVTQAGVAAVRRKASPWTLRSGDWFAPTEHLRTLFASVINADPDGVAIVPSVSYGVALAAANVPVASGQSIVLLEGEFPSNFYAWRELTRRSGGVLRMVARPPSGDWTDSVLSAIDSTTAVVAVPNCHWTDGRFVDLHRVGTAARSVGAAFVIDGSQSLGAYPLDVASIQPDFLVTVGYKWLLGPYGLAHGAALARIRCSARAFLADPIRRGELREAHRLLGELPSRGATVRHGRIPAVRFDGDGDRRARTIDRVGREARSGHDNRINVQG